jgi:hypothetical protein
VLERDQHHSAGEVEPPQSSPRRTA